MRYNDIEQLLATAGGLVVRGGRAIIWDTLDLYDRDKDTTTHYDTLAELLEDNEDIAARFEEVDEWTVEKHGRGSSGGAVEMGGGFTSAGGDASEHTPDLLPARLNIGNARGTTVERVTDVFQDRYANSRTEYGAVVDRDGYVVQHRGGGETSVALSAQITTPDSTTIHNHPGQGHNAFSEADLTSWASTRNERRMIVTNGTNSRSSIEKLPGFDGQRFTRAMRRAQWPSNLSYEDGSQWWLSRNAGEYRYRYTRTN